MSKKKKSIWPCRYKYPANLIEVLVFDFDLFSGIDMSVTQLGMTIHELKGVLCDYIF